jgi:glycosyltransferase involved in cell wall biosynthesis
MKLSVIIPAFNEEKLLPACLASVFAALQTHSAADWTSEVIVVDNNSTDRTAELACAAGARVVFEPINQISSARNAGAAAAAGDWFLFVDADSILAPQTLADLLACIRRGRHAGGGCLVGLDEAPFLGRLFIEFWNGLSRLAQWAAGSFVFCRAEAFRDIGGFPTDLFAAEELKFSIALKAWARDRGLRFVILTGHRHVSSGRKFRLYGQGEMFRLMLRSLFFTRRTLQDRKHLDLFYDGRR